MRSEPAPKRTFLSLTSRLEGVGLKRDFVRSALAPAWWSRDDEKNPNLLAELEFSVARFLRAPIERVRDPAGPLAIPAVSAKLRKPKNLSVEEVSPAVYVATMIAQAAVRNLMDVPAYQPLPSNPLEFRNSLLNINREAVTLGTLLDGLWSRGIPVIRACKLPTPKFRAMACWAKDRPVIILALGGKDHPKHQNDLAHEAGHIACGHVSAESLTVDSGAEDDSDVYEKEANIFQSKLLFGENKWPDLTGVPPHSSELQYVAKLIRAKAREQRVDSGLMAHCWITKNNMFRSEATLLRELHKYEALSVIDKAVSKHINIEDAPETDANLLRCVFDEDCD